MAKVQCFIDGYNLYHAMDELKIPKLHWVNLWNLMKSYLPREAELTHVYLFTAKPTHLNIPIQNRHSEFVNAQKAFGVTVIEGQFKKKNLKCKSKRAGACKHDFIGHEEKESDVNLAVQFINDAHEDHFDIALIVTADSDLVPPMKFVKERFSNKEIWLISPPKKNINSKELEKNSNKQITITSKQIRKFLMHERVIVNHQVVATRPPQWSI